MKHGEYENYDPYVGDEDGDDSEHEGYYPDAAQGEEQEYLSDLHRRGYRRTWSDRHTGRGFDPYSSFDFGSYGGLGGGNETKPKAAPKIAKDMSAGGGATAAAQKEKPKPKKQEEPAAEPEITNDDDLDALTTQDTNLDDSTVPSSLDLVRSEEMLSAEVSSSDAKKPKPAAKKKAKA